MQSLLQRFGASRRRVHVRHWRCGRLSQSAAAAADTPQEATIPVSNEEEGSGEPAHQTTCPCPSRSFRSASSLMSLTGACAINTWVHWSNFTWTAFAHRTSPIEHSHMLSFACSRRVRISEWHAARRFVFLLNGAFSAAMASVCMCAALTRSPTCHAPKPGNLTFLSLNYQPFPARPSHCPHSCEHAVFFAVAERQSQVRPVHVHLLPAATYRLGRQ